MLLALKITLAVASHRGFRGARPRVFFVTLSSRLLELYSSAPLRMPPILVLGVVCNDRRVRWRERLRAYYKHFEGSVLVRYLVDQHSTTTSNRSDEIGIAVGAGNHRHCVHKSFMWWSIAERFAGTFYAKTDDDAVLDLGRILLLLATLPTQRVYGGILRYSSIDESTLEGSCWSSGAYGSLNQRSQKNSCGHGPIVYAEGPFELLSSDVQAWLAPRLHLDERQRCHYEDLLIGRELARHDRLQLVNLGPLLEEPNVFLVKGEWIGVKGPLAHWTRTDAAFERATTAFSRAASAAPLSPMPPLSCSPWSASFPRLLEFPCCVHNWTLCESEAATAEWRRLRRVYAATSRGHPRPKRQACWAVGC